MSSTTPPSRRSSVHLGNFTPLSDLYSDSRTHGYQGPIRNVRLPRATSTGGGAIAKSEDGIRCVVAGRESLRILRMSESSQNSVLEHKSTIGRGGHRIDASRNIWEGSGLKIDSASTDVAWCHGILNNKILTSARNGDLIMWDLSKSGPTKYERRTKDHIRSIHQLSYSQIVHYYCVTGSADGDVRVWDLRDMSRSLMKIHHPTSVRGVVFSPIFSQPLQAVVGLDNGSIYRWDLKMGQRGLLDRLPVAHSGPILALDWCETPDVSSGHSSTAGGVLGDGVSGGGSGGAGWIVSGGLDRTVKVWDLTASGSNTHIPHKPAYVLHPSFPIRRVLWRPGYECELAVVSNAEFGTGSNPDLSQIIAGASQGTPGTDAPGGTREKNISGGGAGGVGDHIEIWDVRRGWVAKWAVSGSAAEGGVTDVAFGDSHALWAQHTSGTFSQLDLRHCTKPLDAIPRTAASWEVSGSLAFVADKASRWEIPYDDIMPENKQGALDRHARLKVLGDRQKLTASQSMGTYAPDYAMRDLSVFAKLARGYVVHGGDRRTICSINAEVAFEAGKEQAAQMWLLMGSLFIDLIPDDRPPTPPLSPLPIAAIPGLAHSASAPAAIPTVYSFPAHGSTERANSSDQVPHTVKATQSSPGQASKEGHNASHSATQSASSNRNSRSPSQKPTPTSSASSSPHRPLSALPSVTPRPPSNLGRRESSAGLLHRSSSPYRRPSVSIASAHSESPKDSVRSHSSLRHVGEGALDDSDSSGSSSGDGTKSNSDEESSLKPLISPHLNPRIAPAHPSPLSRVAGQQQWTEDEDDKADEDEESSPSPGSTDTESSSSGGSRRKVAKSLSRRSSHRTKTRSRSSTVASLAASAVHHRPLEKQESRSSIRTVTAGDVSIREPDHDGSSMQKDEGLWEMRRGSVDTTASSYAGRRPSHALSSEFRLNPEDGENANNAKGRSSRPVDQTSDHRKEAIRAEEARYRELGWEALRGVVDQLSDEGDVQMCALLSIVASQELRIGPRKAAHFLEAYIDLLCRLRMHTSAAYLRKHSEIEDVRASAGLETTIYTSCGRCRKPITYSAFTQNAGECAKGGFSYCLSCQSHSTKCSICNMPVLSLLFQCSVCAHGGHQECYRRYYMNRPMVEMPGSAHSAEIRGRSTLRSNPSLDGDSDGDSIATTEVSTELDDTVDLPRGERLMGHPCAAGCGHFCWAASGDGGET